MSILLITTGTMAAECRPTPQDSFLLMRKNIYSFHNPYTTKLNNKPIFAKKDLNDAGQIITAIKLLNETPVEIYLFGIIDLPSSSIAAGKPMIRDHGITIFGFNRDINFTYEITPDEIWVRALDKPTDYELKITTKLMKHTCVKEKFLCMTEMVGDSTTRGGNFPSEVMPDIVSAKNDIVFNYKLHVSKAREVSIDGCIIPVLQVDISGNNWKQTKFMLLNWFVAANSEADLNGISLVSKDDYYPIYSNLVR